MLSMVLDPRYVLDPLYVLFTLFGCLDGGKGLDCNFPLDGSKMEIFKIEFFFDIMTIHSDQISYVYHVLDPLSVFSTPFGCWRGDGGLLKDFVTS